MKPYTVTQINQNTYQIAEIYHHPAALPMYLILGENRAALIDTGVGMGTLRSTVEEITSLPVCVYNTHAHLDHAAGNSEFNWVYMHPDEEERARGDFPREDRIEFVELKCMSDPDREEIVRYARENMPPYESEYDIFYVEEGDVIDLGGHTLEPIHVPGHTSGSMVYVDREHRNAFCGDAVNPRSSIGMFPGAPTVRCYAESLERFLSMTPEIERYYVGHRLYYFTREDVEDVLTCAKEIVAGVAGEPYDMIVSRKGPIRGWIHWYNGKRITFQKEYIG
ncbi:MAG: MBL fold metallo-hydrolase [Lachnospiraceae bacterium]|nr:MBL fold metallo-hydrolase [Lachnospiraceae bacterium]